MILNYLLASGWTPEQIIRTGATLTVALLALAGAVLGLERLLKRADGERAAIYAPLGDLMDGPEDLPPLPQRVPGEQVGDDTLAMVADDCPGCTEVDADAMADLEHLTDAELDQIADEFVTVIKHLIGYAEAEAEDARNAMQHAIHPVGRDRFFAEVEDYLKEQS